MYNRPMDLIGPMGFQRNVRHRKAVRKAIIDPPLTAKRPPSNPKKEARSSPVNPPNFLLGELLAK